MIYDELEPLDWKDLQNKVAQEFIDIGCEAEVEKQIETARGKVSVDVYAVDRTQQPARIFLCECKYWNSTIPQTIVHAFRTVVADDGANDGYVISKVGFQKGALETAKNTNVRLLDWSEFQSIFEERWREARIGWLESMGRILREYVDPGLELQAAFDGLTEDKKQVYRGLRERYYYLAYLCSETSLAAEFGKGALHQLKIPTGDNEVLADREIHSEVEYCQILSGLCGEGIEAFDTLMGRAFR